MSFRSHFHLDIEKWSFSALLPPPFSVYANFANSLNGKFFPEKESPSNLAPPPPPPPRHAPFDAAERDGKEREGKISTAFN